MQLNLEPGRLVPVALFLLGSRLSSHSLLIQCSNDLQRCIYKEERQIPHQSMAQQLESKSNIQIDHYHDLFYCSRLVSTTLIAANLSWNVS